jgi:hypothetical protein
VAGIFVEGNFETRLEANASEINSDPKDNKGESWKDISGRQL